MDTLTDYDDDVYAWAREQAAVLRGMTRQPGLPNALDLTNVAEEIESVGSEARHSVESFVRLVLVHLIKVAISPHIPSHARWRGEVINFHAEILGRYSRSMRQDIKMDVLWRRAARQAESTLSEYGEDLPRVIPTACPLDLDDLTAETLDFEMALQRIVASFTPQR